MAIQRPLKTSGVRTYVDERNNGFPIIEAAELDADFQTIYDAVNTGQVVLPPLADASVLTNMLAPSSVTTPKLADGAVTGPKIPANTITDAHLSGTISDTHIANVSWSKLLGVPTSFAPGGAAGGDLAGSTYPAPVIAAGAVTRAKTAPDLWLAPIPTGGNVGQFLTVGAGPTLAWAALPAQPIADGSILEPKYASGSVSTRALADASVTAAKIQPGVIPSQLPPVNGSVTAASMAPNSVGNAALQSKAVTLDKVDQDSVPLPPWPTHANLGQVLSVIEDATPDKPVIAWVDPSVLGSGGGGGGGGLWTDDVNASMLVPTAAGYGVALPAIGSGLVIRHSSYPTIDRRTGIDADDNLLQISAGGQGILFRSVDAATPLALVSGTGTWRLATDALPATERLEVGGGVLLGAALAAQNGTLQYASGHIQARLAGAWVNLDTASGGLPEAPTDGKIYGRGGSTPAWTPVLPLTGGTLTGLLGIQAPASGTDEASLVFGSRTAKGRLTYPSGFDQVLLSINRRWTGSGWAQDDATKPSWHVSLDVGDAFGVSRQAPAGASALLLSLDNAGRITVTADPTAALHLATKQYVDAHGLPVGGTAGQVLTKNSATAYDAGWAAIPLGGSNGSLGTQTSYTANAILTTANQDSLINANAGHVQLTLPAFSTALAGQIFRITRVDSNAATQATIMPAGADFIDAVNSFITLAPYESVSLMACGTVANNNQWVRVSDPTWKTIQTGNVLTPRDANKYLVSGASGDAIQWGARTAKGRLTATRTTPDNYASAWFTLNYQFNGNSFGGASDDTAQPSWALRFRATTGQGDDFQVIRAPATSGFPSLSTLLSLDNVGQLTIAPTGGSNALTWGSQPGKCRLTAGNASPYAEFSVNRTVTNTQDDATKPSWFIGLDAGPSDRIFFQRCKAGDTSTQTTPLQMDAAGHVTIPGPTAAVDQAQLVLSADTSKGRVVKLPGMEWMGVTLNAIYNGSAWSKDDTSKPSWMMNTAGDSFFITRSAAGASWTSADLLRLDNGGGLTLFPPIGGTFPQVLLYGLGAFGGTFRAFQSRGTLAAPTPTLNNDVSVYVGGYGCYTNGSYSEQAVFRCQATENWSSTNRGTSAAILVTPVGTSTMNATFTFNSDGSFFITGPVGQKSTGTTWANPCDRRLKDGIEDYTTGLSAILALQPRTFVYNGKGGSQAGLRGYGYIADEAGDVIPEMLGITKAKLSPDDEEPTDIQTLDTSNVTLALVNAVKELAGRVAALEAR